jgi:hypothetical protein
MHAMEATMILMVKTFAICCRPTSPRFYKLIKAGKLPTFRVGDDWRSFRDRDKRWIAEQDVGAYQ